MRVHAALPLLAAALASLAPATARAQMLPPGEVAVPIRPSAQRPPAAVAAAPEPRDLHILVKLTGGAVFTDGLPAGGYGRFGVEGMIEVDPDRATAVWGVWDAFEGWGAQRRGGFGLPLLIFGGFKTPTLLATIGGGVNLFTIDGHRGDAAFGIFSPRANARLGVHVGALFVGVEGDVQRRWRWGADDATLFQVGLTVAIVEPVEAPEPPRR